MASLACSCLNGDLAYVECILWDCIRSQPIATYLWGVPKKRPEEVLQKGRQAWQNAFNYTTMVLEQEPFTPFSSQGIFAPKMFYTISFSHWMTLTLTPDRFYTKQFLHQKSFDYSTGVLKREPFTAKSCFSPGTFIPKKFCTIFFLHRTTFTPEDAYTPNLLRQRVFSPICLDQTTFTTEDVYTSNHLHQRPFTLEAFYSRGTSHQRVFTLERFYTAGLLQQNMFTRGTSYTKQALCIKEFLRHKLYNHQVSY